MITNFQYIPYTLIAVALINGVYRHNDSKALTTSAILILVGGLLFLIKRLKAFEKLEEKSAFRITILVIAAFLIIFTLL